MGQAQNGRPGLSREALAGAALLVLGVAPRLLVALNLPTVAFSDFRALIGFGVLLKDHGWIAGSWHWVQFNPGLAMALSLVFRFFDEPSAAARLATATVTGLVPLLPFFLWRSVLPLAWRFIAGALLALWPGQIFFAGVVAQENWALVPTVALGALAVRVLRSPQSGAHPHPHPHPHPIVAGLLLAAAAAFRQEMLLALLPAAAAAAGLFQTPGRARRAAWLGAAAGLGLLALALQRQAASGRFALTTEHGGLSLLGSVAPGAARAGWVDPRTYIASIEPELLEDRDVARREAVRLALSEWKRRPAFHTLRAASVTGRLAVESDAENLFWSIGSSEALPEALRPRGTVLYARWFPRLRWELALIQGLFAASVLLALRHRDAAGLVLSACVLIKFALHSAASPLGRLMVPATALELLAIGLGLFAVATRGTRLRFGLVALGVAVALLVAEPRLTASAIARDDPPRPVARFPLEITGGPGHARCVVEEGVLTSLEWRQASLRPGVESQVARVVCRARDGVLRVRDTQGTVRESPRADGSLEITLEGAAGFGLARTP